MNTNSIILIIFTKELSHLLDLIQTWFSPKNTISLALFSTKLWYLSVHDMEGREFPGLLQSIILPSLCKYPLSW